MIRKTFGRGWVCLTAVVLLAEAGVAQVPLPAKVVFAEKDLRALLPPDGKLVQEGKISNLTMFNYPIVGTLQAHSGRQWVGSRRDDGHFRPSSSSRPVH
jgi:hypothetical protein